MTFGSLFAGIGGIDLGLERAGMRCAWQVEVDPFCLAVLTKHWPEVERHRDVRDVRGWFMPRVDLIAGGFPCQDISSAHTNGRRRGLGGERSGLWTEFRRLVAECLPRWAVVENVAQWRSWVPVVRADLCRLGYASVPVEVSAEAVGAPHARPRCFVVAHANGDGESLRAFDAEMARVSALSTALPWPDSPYDVRMDDGISDRMDRLAALGNAVVPQVAEVIGRAILAVSNA